MKYSLLDTVVLTRAIPENSLEPGSIGAVVATYSSSESGEIEVEFVSRSGLTRAVLTLKPADIRHATRDDIAKPPPMDRPA